MNLLKLTIFLGLVVGLSLFFLRYIETHTLFYPTQDIDSLPSRLHLEFQDVYFKTTDQLTLNGWYVESKGAQHTILFCHGNAGNISHRIEKLKFFHDSGCNVFIFDYRGYGRSQGRPSEQGLYQDAKAAYGWLIGRGIEKGQIIGYGESIGGAVLVDLGSKEEMKAVILDSTLTSVKDLIGRAYPFVPYWMFSSRFDSETKIRSIKVPKLIIHSQNDEIIPYAIGKKLFDVSPEPKEFLKIYGGHNSGFFESQGSLRETIGHFLSQLKTT